MVKNNTSDERNQVVTQKLTDRKTRTMHLYKRVFAWDYKSAARYYNCGTQIAVQNGAIKSANFCRDRLCPMCSYRRAQKAFSQNMAVYQKIKEDNPKARQIFLTLTVPNVKLWQLKKTLKEMSVGWNRFRNHRQVKKQPIIGYCRKLEITYNKDTRTYHPHYHVMLTVVGRSARIEEYVRWWSTSMQLGRQLVCYVQAVRGDAKSVAEMSKYMTKSDDILDALQTADEWSAYRAAIFSVRELSYGGIWRTYRRELGYVDDPEKDDLTDTDVITHSEAPIIWMEWQHAAGCYVVVDITTEYCFGDIIANDLALLRRKIVV